MDQRPDKYVEFQKKIHAAINDVIPLAHVRYIDECEVALIGAERELQNATEIALQIKRQLREKVGEYITVSIGISTSHKIAKIAAEQQKPNGLTIIQKNELPQRLYGLTLQDLPGISTRNQKRLNAHGIYTVEELATRSKEDLHRAFGYVPAPKLWHKYAKMPLKDIAETYLEWGEKSGGRRNLPWCEVHLRNRRAQLTAWHTTLGYELLGEVEHCKPHVEAILADMRTEGKVTEKTLGNKLDTLSAFFSWCVERKFLECDPLQGLERFDTTPEETRRALMLEEIERLMKHAPPHRALLWRTMMLTGYCVREMRFATLDTRRKALCVDAAYTKNRKPACQPLPLDLFEELAALMKARKALATDPVFTLPLHPDRRFNGDRDRAGIPETLDGGLAVTHSLRHTFISHLDRIGFSEGERVTMARHHAGITTKVYTHVEWPRLQEFVEALNTRLFGRKCVAGVKLKVVGAEMDFVNAESGTGLELVGAQGALSSNPATPILSSYFKVSLA